MHRHSRLAILGVLLAGSFVCAQGKDKGKKPAVTPNYYPLEIGNVWTYKVTVGDKTFTSISTITKDEMFDKLTLARLELRVAGELKAVEHLRQTEAGVFRYRNNEAPFDPPLLLLPYPIKAGTSGRGRSRRAMMRLAPTSGTRPRRWSRCRRASSRRSVPTSP